ncbi:MAG: glycine cleavage system aminomethyltransferase GcvT [Myxococcota bacterium]
MAETQRESLKTTPLAEEHERLGGRMVPFAGYRMPVQYAGIVKEHHAVRQAAGLFDVSHMGELILRGDRAVDVVDGLVTNDVKHLPVGKALYTVACNEVGRILDDLIIYRRGEDDILVVCNASNHAKMSAHFEAAAKNQCSYEDATASTSLLALQGPKAFSILERAGADATTLNLESFALCQTTLSGAEATIARTGYTGEDGVEIFCANKDAPAVFRGLLEAGEGSVQPTGLGCRDTLRLEACLSLYGNEIDETTHPFEARLGWVVKLDKGDFLGRDSLQKFKTEGLARKLVGFEMTGRGIGRAGYPILDPAGQQIGHVTSGSPAPTLGKNIGLGYVPKTLSKVGTPLGIEIRGKVIEAVVVKTPFYKRST